jgi:WD40 repeat protein
VDAVAFTPDGKAVVTAGSGMPARLWDIQSGRQLFRPEPKMDESSYSTAVACSPDGKFVASAEGLSDGAIVLRDVASGREVRRFRPTGDDWVNALAFSLDGRTLASGGQGPTILLWEVPD